MLVTNTVALPPEIIAHARSLRHLLNISLWLCHRLRLYLRFLQRWCRRCALFFFQLGSSRWLRPRHSSLFGLCRFLACGAQFSSCRRLLACCLALSGLSRLFPLRTALCHCTLLASEHTS